MFAAGQARAAAYQAAYQAAAGGGSGNKGDKDGTHSTGVRDVTSHVPFQLFLSAAVDFEKMARVPTCPMSEKTDFCVYRFLILIFGF